MKIAVASGKGGTGKTTVATNLAYVAANKGKIVAYLDCDVEEPNGHIFLKPEFTNTNSVTNPVPEVNENDCINCGKCGKICQYSAIVCIGEKVVVFPELCHSCGGCTLVCPVEAIKERPVEIGKLDIGHSGNIHFVQGLLNVGQAMSSPLIRKVKDSVSNDFDLIIMDAPPGTSCPVIESVRDCDYIILVTESTPFGLNDLKLAVEMTNALGLSFGVVINRADTGDQETRSYCQNSGIPILAEIPEDRKVAEVYSRGEIICEKLNNYESLFADLLNKIGVND